MAKRTFEIQSRNMFCGPEQRSFGEIYDVSVQADFSDDAEEDNDFNFYLYSDNKRWKETGEYFNLQKYMGNISTTNRIKVRHNIQIAPRVGFFGMYFKYKIRKTISTDGIFNWYGVAMDVVPQMADQEFTATLDNITVGW